MCIAILIVSVFEVDCYGQVDSHMSVEASWSLMLGFNRKDQWPVGMSVTRALSRKLMVIQNGNDEIKRGIVLPVNYYPHYKSPNI